MSKNNNILSSFVKMGINPITGNRVSGTKEAARWRPTIDRGNPTGFEFHSKWDAGLNSKGGMDARHNRGYNQGVVGSYTNTAIATGLGTLAKTGMMLGTVLDYSTALLGAGTNSLGMSSVDKAFRHLGVSTATSWADFEHSSLTNMFKAADEKVNQEWFPRYGSAAYQEGSFANKFFTLGFWQNEVNDAGQFLLSAYLTGRVAGALATPIIGVKGVQATQAMSTAIKSSGSTAAMRKATASSLKSLTATQSRAVTTFANTVGEAGVEADEIRHMVYSEAIKKGMSHDDALKAAGSAAYRTFLTNAVVLVLPNYIQSTWFHSDPLKMQRAIKAGVMDKTPVGKIIGSRMKYLNEAGKAALSEGGWEENSQESVKHLEKMLIAGDANLSHKDLDFLDVRNVQNTYQYSKLLLGSMIKGMKYLGEATFGQLPRGSEEEAHATAIATGMIIGGRAALMSTRSERQAAKKFYKKYAQRWEEIIEDSDQAAKVFVDEHRAALSPTGTYTKENEDGTKEEITSYLDANNETKSDPNSAMRMTQKGLNNLNFFTASIMSILNNNFYGKTLTESIAHAGYAYNLANIKGITLEEIDALIDNDFALEGSEAVGIEPGHLKERAEESKKLVRRYLDLANDLISVDQLSNENAETATHTLARTQFYLETKIAAFNKFKEHAAKKYEADPDKLAEVTANIDNMIAAHQKKVDLISSRSKEMIASYVDVIEKGIKLGEESADIRTELAGSILHKEGTPLDADGVSSRIERQKEINYVLAELTRGQGFAAESLFGTSQYYSASNPKFSYLDKKERSIKEQIVGEEASHVIKEAELAVDLEEASRTTEVVGEETGRVTGKVSGILEAKTFAQKLKGALLNGFIPSKEFVEDLKRSFEDTINNFKNRAETRYNELSDLHSALVASKSAVEEKIMELPDRGAELSEGELDELYKEVLERDGMILGRPHRNNFLAFLEDSSQYDPASEASDFDIARHVVDNMGLITDALTKAINHENTQHGAANNITETIELAEQASEKQAPSYSAQELSDEVKRRFFGSRVSKMEASAEQYESDPDNFVDDMSTFLTELDVIESVFRQRQDIEETFRDEILTRIQSLKETLLKAQKASQVNQEKRYAEQKQSEIRIIASMEESMGHKNGVFDRTNPLIKLIIDTLGEEAFAKWETLYNETENKTIELIETLVSVASESSEEFGNSLLTIIQKIAEDTRIDAEARGYKSVALSKLLTRDLPQFWGDPLGRFLSAVLVITGIRIASISNPQENDVVTPLHRLFATRNIEEFRAAYKTGKLDYLPEEQRSNIGIMFEVFDKAYAIYTLHSMAKSTLKAKELAEVFHAQFEEQHAQSADKRKIFFTSQQKIAIKQLAYFILGKVFKFHSRGNHTISLKGIFGAGKSQVGAKAIVKLLTHLGKSKEEIMTIGHAAASSSNIANSVELPVNTYEDAISKLPQKGSKVKYLIVDEAYAMNNEKISTLLEVTAKAKVKVIFMGDPSQNKVEAAAEVDSVHRAINNVESLTIVLRTDNPVISNLSKKFKYVFNRIESVYLQSTLSLQSVLNNGGLEGSISASRENIIKIANQANGKSKAIIVNNAQAKSLYQGSITNKDVSVYTHAESQGITVDEVYVDILYSESKEDGSAWNSRMDFNSAIAAAISRAVHGVVMAENGEFTFTHAVETESNATQADISTELEQYGNDMMTSVQNYHAAQEALTGEKAKQVKKAPPAAVPAKPSPTVVNEPVPTSENSEDVDLPNEFIVEEEAQEQTEVTPMPRSVEVDPGSLVKLREPQSNNIRNKTRNTSTAAVPGHIAKISISRGGKIEELWGVFMDTGETFSDGTPKFMLAAVLTEQDVKNVESKMKIKDIAGRFKSTPAMAFTEQSMSAAYKYDDIAASIGVSDIAVQNASKISLPGGARTNTGAYPATTMSEIAAKIVDGLTKDFAEEYSNEDLKAMKKIVMDGMSVKIFNQKAKNKLLASIQALVYRGVPYVTTEPFQFKGKHYPQLVYRVNGPSLFNTSPHVKTLREYVGALTDFAKLTKTEDGKMLDMRDAYHSKEFNGFIESFAKLFEFDPVTVASGSATPTFSLSPGHVKAVKELIKIYKYEPLGDLESFIAAAEKIVRLNYAPAESVAQITLAEAKDLPEFYEFKPYRTKSNLAKPEDQQQGTAYIRRPSTAKDGSTVIDTYTSIKLAKNKGLSAQSWVALNRANEFINGSSYRTRRAKKVSKGSEKTIRVSGGVKALMSDNIANTQLTESMKTMIKWYSTIIRNYIEHPDLMSNDTITRLFLSKGSYAVSKGQVKVLKTPSEVRDYLKARSKEGLHMLKHKGATYEYIHGFMLDNMFDSNDIMTGPLKILIDHIESLDETQREVAVSKAGTDSEHWNRNTFDLLDQRRQQARTPVQFADLQSVVNPSNFTPQGQYGVPQAEGKQPLREPLGRMPDGNPTLHGKEIDLSTPEGQQMFDENFRSDVKEVLATTVTIGSIKAEQKPAEQEVTEEAETVEETTTPVEQTEETVEQAPEETSPVEEAPPTKKTRSRKRAKPPGERKGPTVINFENDPLDGGPDILDFPDAAPVTEDPSAPIEEQSDPLIEKIKKIVESFTARFNVNAEVITLEEAEKLLSSSEAKNFFFQILDEVNLFAGRDPNEVKRFIDKVFRTVENKEEARKAYRKLAAKYHPDKQSGSEELMKYLTNAKDNYDAGRTNTSYTSWQQGPPRDSAQEARDRAERRYQQSRQGQEQRDQTWQEKERAWREQRQEQDWAGEAWKRARQAQERQQKETSSQAREDIAKRIEKIDQKLEEYRKQSRELEAKYNKDRDKLQQERLSAFKAAKTVSTFWGKRKRSPEARQELKNKAEAIYRESYDKLYDEYVAAKANIRELTQQAISKRVEEQGKAYRSRWSLQYTSTGAIAGFYDPVNKKAYIIAENANDTTAIHEIFTHPFLDVAENENPELYNNLLAEAKKNKAIVRYVNSKYAKEHRDKEYIARAIDLEAEGKLKSKGLVDYIKDFWNFITGVISPTASRRVSDLSPKTTVADLVDFVLASDMRLDLSNVDTKKAELDKQALLEKNVQDLKDKRNALRGEDGTVPNENMAEWQSLNKEINKAIVKARRGDTAKTQSHISIKTKPKSVEENPTVLTGEDAEIAETIIEKIISKGIADGLSTTEIIQKINARYAFDGNSQHALNNYISDRNSNAPEIGNNKQSFPAWRKGKYDAELTALEQIKADKKAKLERETVEVKFSIPLTSEEITQTVDVFFDPTQAPVTKAKTRRAPRKVRIRKAVAQSVVALSPVEKTQLAEELKVEEEKLPEAIEQEVTKEFVEETRAKKENTPVQTPTRSNLLQKVITKIKHFVIAVLLFSTTLVSLNSNLGNSLSMIDTSKAMTIENLDLSKVMDFSDVLQNQEQINNFNNFQTIVHSMQNETQPYVIIDDQTGVAHFFRGKELQKTYRVATGRNVGDHQSMTVQREINGQTVTLWEEGNAQTGAGIYTVKFKGISPYTAERKASSSWVVENARGIEVPMAMHEPFDKGRKKAMQKAKSGEELRLSSGCINFSVNDIADINASLPDFNSGSKVFVLPEDNSNQFELIDGQLTMTSSDPKVNRSLNVFTPEPVIFKYNEPGQEISSFMSGIQESKAALMSLFPTISNQVYNELAIVAYGMAGQESKFGTFTGPRAAYGNLRDKAAIALTDKNVSVGVGQVRLGSIPDNVRATFNIQTRQQLLDEYTNGIAVMGLIMSTYVNEIPHAAKANYRNLIPLAYNNRTEYEKALAEKNYEKVSQHTKQVLKFAEGVKSYVATPNSVLLDVNIKSINYEQLQTQLNSGEITLEQYGKIIKEKCK